MSHDARGANCAHARYSLADIDEPAGPFRHRMPVAGTYSEAMAGSFFRHTHMRASCAARPRCAVVDGRPEIRKRRRQAGTCLLRGIYTL
jgi:hypothetical protein